MLLLLLIIFLTSVNSLNGMSEPRRTSTGLNGVQLTFAVNHVSQISAEILIFIPNQECCCFLEFLHYFATGA